MNRIALAVLVVTLAGCGMVPGGKCEEKRAGGPFCIPDAGVAAAGQKLSFEAVDQCTSACGTSKLSCVVERDGGTLTLHLVGEVCPSTGGGACPAICKLVRTPCAIAPLEEGDYTVVSPGQSAQTLQVRDGGATGCTAAEF